MPVFEEIQRFNQWWSILLKIAVISVPLYGLYQIFVLGLNPDTSNRFSPLLGAIICVLIILAVSFSFIVRLDSRIDEEGILVVFNPFGRAKRLIRWRKIKECYVRTYKPIQEYGGWGYRVLFVKKSSGIAYNTKGNKGLQLVLETGEKILIGTQKPIEVKQIINRYFKNNDRI